jgi:hypothetical protein
MKAIRKLFKKRARAMGKVGGLSTSTAKAEAVRENGKMGGRPRQFPPCPRYKAHRFSQKTGRCPCGYQRNG